MADNRTQALDFIYWTVMGFPKSKRRKFLIGADRINQRAVTTAMGVDEARLSKVLSGVESPGLKFYDGLRKLAGYALFSDLYAELEKSHPAPSGAFGGKYP